MRFDFRSRSMNNVDMNEVFHGQEDVIFASFWKFVTEIFVFFDSELQLV